MRIYDITQPLTDATPVWPGDESVTLVLSASMARGATVNVGRLSTSLHAGTHVDAPYHYRSDGARVDAYEIERFVGACAVIACPTLFGPVNLQVVEEAWSRIASPVEAGTRVLIQTRATRGLGWSNTFPHLTVEVVGWLASIGCRLVGLDAPSYDPMDSKTLDAHHALAEAGIANLENLVLDDVPEGVYTLAALPMAIVGMDAAPVRAVLIDGWPSATW